MFMNIHLVHVLESNQARAFQQITKCCSVRHTAKHCYHSWSAYVITGISYFDTMTTGGRHCYYLHFLNEQISAEVKWLVQVPLACKWQARYPTDGIWFCKITTQSAPVSRSSASTIYRSKIFRKILHLSQICADFFIIP